MRNFYLSKIQILFMAILFATGVNAQINYTRTTFTGPYTPITVGGGATQISTVGTGLGDFTTTLGVANGLEGAAHILLPFTNGCACGAAFVSFFSSLAVVLISFG